MAFKKRKSSTTIFSMRVYPEHVTTWGQICVRRAALTFQAYRQTLTNEVTGQNAKNTKRRCLMGSVFLKKELKHVNSCLAAKNKIA